MFRICKIECHPRARYSDSGESATMLGRSQIISSLEVGRDLRDGKELGILTFGFQKSDITAAEDKVS
jgi:hypothetical protein